jgi:hypothetical protein
MLITKTDEGKFYDGFPSVTTVVDILAEPWLARWRGRVGNEEADRIAGEAAWLGDLVHDTLSANELVDTPIDPSKLDPDSAHAVNLYLEWKAKMVEEILAVELTLKDDELQLGGTLDRLVLLKGDPRDWVTLIDFKTGHRSKKHKYQTAGYCILVRKCMGIEVKRRLVLYLPKSEEKGKSLNPVELTNQARHESIFMKLIDVYNDLRAA